MSSLTEVSSSRVQPTLTASTWSTHPKQTQGMQRRKKTLDYQNKTAKFERSPLYRIISSWNAHPTFSFGNIKQQKTELQKHLITINAEKM
jgi:hypothetical protein